MKVLVTGATGFIGRHLVPELLRRDIHVIASSRSAEKARLFSWFPEVEYVPFEIASDATPDVACFGRPDVLLHLAWGELGDFSSPLHIDRLLPAHLKFLTAMIDAGLKQCVVAGTCLEYGKNEGVLRESDPPRPEIGYAIAKEELRRSLMNIRGDSRFRLRWIRLFYLYGRGQNPKSLLAQLDRALERGDEVFDMSPGDQLRDYLPVENAAELIARIALNVRFDGIVNCCSGEPITVRDLVEMRLRELHGDIRLNLGKLPYPEYEAKSFWGDVSRLREVTEQIP
jgi:dTDP-6-deoxy-L-talose 4-dehydrogenase (NAD+)